MTLAAPKLHTEAQTRIKVINGGAGDLTPGFSETMKPPKELCPFSVRTYSTHLEEPDTGDELWEGSQLKEKKEESQQAARDPQAQLKADNSYILEILLQTNLSNPCTHSQLPPHCNLRDKSSPLHPERTPQFKN